MFARKLDIRRRMSTLSLSKGLSLFSARHLLVPKNPAAKSRVSITSKLIQTKGLQLHYFGHLRKRGGGGGGTDWYTPRRSSPLHPPPCRFHHTVPRAYCASPSYNGTYQYPGNLREPALRVCVLCLQVPQCPPLIARSWTVWNAAISSSPFFPLSLCLFLPADWPLLCIPWCSSIRKKTRPRCAWPSSDSARLRCSSSGISSIASAPSPSLSSTCLPNWSATSRCSFRLARTCSTPCPTRTISGIA